jgi:hypothetical protein
MRLYQYIDEFITDTQEFGGEFTRSNVRDWAEACGYSFNIGSALTQHREHPHDRAYTTERVGMGPHAYYRVVETNSSVNSPSVARMHRQQAKEMVERWGREYLCRMRPVARRSKRARRVLEQAEKEMAAVATLLGVRMRYIDDEEGE